MTANPVQLQKYLGGIDYPADKKTLVRHAEQRGADGAVLDVLRKIPDGTYHGPNEVSAAIGTND